MKIDSSLPITPGQVQYNKTKVEGEAFKNALEEAQKNKDEKKLRDTCKQLESVFVNMMMKNMRSGGMVEKSHEMEMFEGMFDEKIADEVSKGQGIGLARELYKQLSKQVKQSE